MTHVEELQRFLREASPEELSVLVRAKRGMRDFRDQDEFPRLVRDLVWAEEELRK